MPLFLNGWSMAACHCILEESINHTCNIEVKTHEIAIFVIAYLVVKGFSLLNKMLAKWKHLNSKLNGAQMEQKLFLSA